ncbi:MAG: hypothetical protein E7381_05130, partial [Clostridiales bacterium]|nr:hypothetical protein [Clostridiales bacterium]
VLALTLSSSMLVGTTFAWFTDSVTSSNNVIQTGSLKVGMYYANGDENPASVTWKDAEQDAIFNNDKWEPGYVEARHIKVVNEGTLALKYKLLIVPNGEVEELADVIDVYFVENAQQITRESLASVTPVGTLRDLIEDKDGMAHGALLPNGETVTNAYERVGEVTATIALKMRESAGNEYQNKKIGTDFAIQLLATQYMYEEDTFDKEYDEDATYGTYIELGEGEDLLAAMASAKANMPLTIKLNGNVEWPTEGHHGENNITPASSILIEGNGYSITATGAGVTPLGDTEAPMTLNNVKIVDKSVSYAEGAWEFTYLEMGGTALTCNNVTFADEIQFGTNATFTNCSFESNEENVYAVWVESGSASFTNCTFTGYRGLKMHEAYGTEINSVTVKDCTFSNLTKKPGIAIGTLNADTTVSVTDSIFFNCQPGDQGLYIYETDTDVTTFNFTQENNTVYKNATMVSTKEELLALSAKAFTGNNGQAEEATVVINADIDMQGEDFSAMIAQRGDKLTIVGNNHTISNVNIVSGANDNTTGQASMFYAYPNSTLEVSNLTLKDVTVNAEANGTGYASVVVGYCEGDAILNNVDVENATVVGVKSSGLLIGHLSGSVTATDCDLQGTVTLADFAEEANGHYAGKYVGTLAGAMTLENCTVNATVSGNLNAANLGAIYGRKTAAGSLDGSLVWGGVTKVAELREAFANGGEIVLAEDIKVEDSELLFKADGGHSDGSAFFIKADTVLDLNGHDITVISGNAAADVFFMNWGADLTIKGDGDITADCSIACAYDANSTLNVEGGNFYVTANNDMLYAIYGKINVSGGTFTTSYFNTINIYGQGRIDRVDVSGGSFENWNPETSPDGNLLADGYKVESKVIDGVTWFTVVKA